MVRMWSIIALLTVVAVGAGEIGKVETIFGNSMGLDSRGAMKGDFTGVWDDQREYKYLAGLAVDDFGTLYVADEYGIRYSKARTPDKIMDFTGPYDEFDLENGPSETSKFNDPVSIAVNNDGSKVFVAEPDNGGIRVIITETGPATNIKKSTVYSMILINSNGNEVTMDPGYLTLGMSQTYTEGTQSTTVIYMTTESTIWYEDDENDHMVYKIVITNGCTPNADGYIEGNVYPIAGVQWYDGFENKIAATGQSKFSVPRGMTVDKEGYLYVADSHNNVIRKIDHHGFTWTFAGNEDGDPGLKDGDKNKQAMFSVPSDIVYDAESEAFYVADTGNNAIRKINKYGVVRTIVGGSYAAHVDGTAGCARLTRPRFLAIGPKSTLYFTDVYHSTVRKVSLMEGRFTEYCRQDLTSTVRTIAGQPYEEGHAHGHENTLDEPSDVAVDKFGNIFFTDDDAQCIRKMSRSGFVSVVAGKCDEYGLVDGYGTNARFEDIYSIAINDDGVIYVADRDNEVIRKVAKDGYVSIFAGNPNGDWGDADGVGTNAEFDGPYSVTLDKKGNLFVADKYNNKVKRINPWGRVKTVFHKEFFDEELRAVEYDKFNDRLIVMYDESIYSVNPYGWWNQERIIGRRGDKHNHGTVIDAGVGSAAGFYNPYGLAIDAAGFIFVSDSDNHVIRMISPGPKRTVTTIAGAYDLDGGHADGKGNQARFDWPWGITLDHFGNLIVADADTSTLRKIKIMRPPVA
eukprot:CAMPEP_0182416302 /NCGR_PEP_ID=MMETSP1167-20130531/570_1 /TAXON_ID=2988 /ORGANISM="Mallomonas Sp, Strain CCMP3275" /LENGTH=740 /DNA_ID=CAMNT_0024588949 /DNA_START=70 /DNA_END=2292 /DNA_ORIENTATION=+